ncbi:MAG: serine/threonine-protein kinase [Myxococcota bacterium]
MSVSLSGQIGPYRVLRSIARGGVAEVYEVEEPDTGIRLALKLLRTGGNAARRLAREFQILSTLRHPNVIRVVGYGQDADQQMFLTMQLLDGVVAQEHVRGLGRPGCAARNQAAQRIIARVSSALAALHDRGIVHRDVKSSNVLVSADGGVWLLDFGSARADTMSESITREGEFVGTYAYAAPEQITGQDIDGRTDVYALGVLFYRLLTGRRPFEGEDAIALMRQQLEHQPPPPIALRPGVPAMLSELVMAMLQKVPGMRPTAHEILRALDGARAQPDADAAAHLERALGAVKPRARRVLGALAVAQRSLPFTSIAFATDLAPDELGVHLGALMNQGLVSHWPKNGEWTLPHRDVVTLVMKGIRLSRRYLLEQRLRGVPR